MARETSRSECARKVSEYTLTHKHEDNSQGRQGHTRASIAIATNGAIVSMPATSLARMVRRRISANTRIRCCASKLRTSNRFCVVKAQLSANAIVASMGGVVRIRIKLLQLGGGTTRLESNSSVVRLALVVLEDLVDAIARGEKIIIQDESGQTRTYNAFVALASGTSRPSRDAA
jgi:hypothetical protein